MSRVSGGRLPRSACHTLTRVVGRLSEKSTGQFVDDSDLYSVAELAYAWHVQRLTSDSIQCMESVVGPTPTVCL